MCIPGVLTPLIRDGDAPGPAWPVASMHPGPFAGSASGLWRGSALIGGCWPCQVEPGWLLCVLHLQVDPSFRAKTGPFHRLGMEEGEGASSLVPGLQDPRWPVRSDPGFPRPRQCPTARGWGRYGTSPEAPACTPKCLTTFERGSCLCLGAVVRAPTAFLQPLSCW